MSVLHRLPCIAVLLASALVPTFAWGAGETAAPSAATGSANGAIEARSRAGAASSVDGKPDGELRVQLDEDVITGSAERPKVLYILPWRCAQATPGLDAAPDLKASELFESLDPDAHARQLNYRQALVGDDGAATADD